MIEIIVTGDSSRIILKPSRSSDWQTNKRVIIALAVFSGCIAGGFMMIGAWVILPFAGIEILALGSALYWVNWKLEYREVMDISATTVQLRKGWYKPIKAWTWPRDELSLSVETLRDECLGISLCHKQSYVDLGGFLDADDSKKLLQALRDTSFPLKNYATKDHFSA